MHARSTTIQGDPARMDDGIANVRDDVMPAVRAMDGCIGLSMLCNRDSGLSIITTSWRDEAAMHDSEGMVHDMRRRAAEMMGGRAQVKEWEIALMHRLHEAHNGACTRVIWSQSDPAGADDMVSDFRMTLLSKLDELPGFCSVSVMLDRDSGMAATAVTYDSRQDMMDASEQAMALRTGFAQQAGAEITDITEFDLVLAHLRVPEMV
jgi:quinol monooxygenase YgiN